MIKHNSFVGKNQGLLYILPWLIGFLAFKLYPFAMSMFYSFTNYNLVSEPQFVGIDNFVYMFKNDPDFLHSFRVTFMYVLMAVPGKIIVSLLVAMILAQQLKFISFFRTLYYIPSILGGSVALSALWRFLFMRDGAVNNLLGLAGIAPVHWLGDPDIALLTISLLNVWQFGAPMVIFLAGLKQIPSYLYEAARIDGASRLAQFFRITLPLITPMLFFNLIMEIIRSFQRFTSAFIITAGGPVKSTYIVAMKLFDEAFQYRRMGYASSISWVLFAVILVFTVLAFKSSDRWVYYEDGGK